MTNQDFDAESLFQQAMQAYQMGHAETAIRLLHQVLEQMPQHEGIMATLGGVYAAAGKLQEAIEILNKALQLNPHNVDAKVNLGIAYLNMGNAKEGMRQMKEAAELAPQRADVHYNLANQLLQMQQFSEAITILEKVIQIDPGFLQGYQTLGAVHGYLQAPQKAIEVYQRALLTIPGDLQTSVLLGNAFADMGDTDQALKTYQQAVSTHPQHFLPYAVLGKFYLDIGQNAEGETNLQKALELNPNDLNTNILLGNVSKDFGRIDEAEQFYRKALEISPEDQGALSNLRRILSAKIPLWHFEMLADSQRNDAYQKVIEKLVVKDSHVLDIGTGSGLLSMMAARAGAKQVTACEMHERLAATATEIVALNGFADRITVHNKKSTLLKVGEELGEKVDVIVSEILDVGALGEAVLPSIRHAVQNLAKPDVKLIPARVHLYGQLIEIPSRSKVAPIRTISGFDLSPFEQYRIPNEYLKITLRAEKYRPLSPVIPLMEVDFYKMPIAYADDQPRQIPLQLPITADGTAQAMVFWFDLYLDEETMVSSRPNGELEHWGQALFCFPETKAVKTGEEMKVMMLQSDQMIRFSW